MASAATAITGVPRAAERIRCGDGSVVFLSREALESGSLPGLKIPKLARRLALERYKPWWLRPNIGGTDLTFEFEVQYLLWERTDGRYGIALPLVCGDIRAFFKGSGELLELVWNGALPGEWPEEAPVLYSAVGEDPFELSGQALVDVAGLLKTFRTREEKAVPGFVDRLGWCTWDAFYHAVSAEKVVEGLASFADRDIPVRYLILDDGWQDVSDSKGLRSFDCIEAKFPGGLASLTEEVKHEFGIEEVGVWHTLQGYWNGIDPEGELGSFYAIATRTEPDGSTRSFVDPRDAYRFFQDYHAHLYAEGVDMVKVDNQSSLEGFSEGLFGRGSTMRAYQLGLQGAVGTQLSGNLIHCMCNTSDVAYNMMATTVWRNSDDFFPKIPESHRFHVHTNAMNNMWTRWFSIPDWDMFQSHHEMGAYHAAARALSGGPVYVSDRPGEQNAELIRKLCLTDGTVLRCVEPALPSRDCLFVDCHREAKLLKITNYHGTVGLLGVFHCLHESVSVSDSWCVEDIPWAAGRDFLVYRHTTGEFFRTSLTRRHAIELGPGEYEIFSAALIDEGFACLGLLDKFNGPRAVVTLGFTPDGSCFAELEEGGRAGFYCEVEPGAVLVDGTPTDFTYDPATGALVVAAAAAGSVIVKIVP